MKTWELAYFSQMTGSLKVIQVANSIQKDMKVILYDTKLETVEPK